MFTVFMGNVPIHKTDTLEKAIEYAKGYISQQLPYVVLAIYDKSCVCKAIIVDDANGITSFHPM